MSKKIKLIPPLTDVAQFHCHVSDGKTILVVQSMTYLPCSCLQAGDAGTLGEADLGEAEGYRI